MTFLGLLERKPETQSLEEVKTTKPLLAALMELDIVPFDRKAVDDYKHIELYRAFSKMKGERMAQGWRPAEVPAFHQYALETRAMLGRKWTDDDLYYYAYNPGLRPTCFAMGWHRAAFASIVEAPVQIPEHAKRKAEQIQAKVPGVTLEADVLESDEKLWDPFLVVKSGDEEYYVEVWSEEDFERVCC